MKNTMNVVYAYAYNFKIIPDLVYHGTLSHILVHRSWRMCLMHTNAPVAVGADTLTDNIYRLIHCSVASLFLGSAYCAVFQIKTAQ
jgi:hypothetical protein